MIGGDEVDIHRFSHTGEEICEELTLQEVEVDEPLSESSTSGEKQGRLLKQRHHSTLARRSVELTLKAEETQRLPACLRSRQ